MTKPMEDFAAFMKESGLPPDQNITIAFFVGYSCGAGASREQFDAIMAAIKELKPAEKSDLELAGVGGLR